MRFRKAYNRRTIVITLFIVFSCVNFSYTSPVLRIPIDMSTIKDRSIHYINFQPLSVSPAGTPNIIDNVHKRIYLNEGGIVVADRRYSLTSGNAPNTTCCFCIVKNTETGHYAAAHIMGKVIGIHNIDYQYKTPEKAISKMISFLKTLDTDMDRKKLVAILIGGGHLEASIQEVALKNFNDTRQILGAKGIFIINEEVVSEYKKGINFSGTDKIDVTHFEGFEDNYAIVKNTSFYFSQPRQGQALASNEREAESPKTLKQELIKFVKAVNPIVPRIVELATAKVGFDIYDRKITVSEYPYGCAVGSIAGQYILEKLYGDRIKMELIELSHPKMEEFEIGMHVAIIIHDNITGRKYFMSFFEGVWNDAYPHERTREIEFHLPDGSSQTDFFTTTEYAEWFESQEFSPEFFEFVDNKDITEKTGLTVLNKYRYEELEETETIRIFSAIENTVDFDALRFLLNRGRYFSSKTIRTGC